MRDQDEVDNVGRHPMDLNKDGKVDRHDFLHAAKVTGVTLSAAAAAVGVSAASAAAAGSALVGSTAAGIGTTIATTGGAVAGSLAGLYAGTSTFGMVAVTQIGSALFIESVSITSVSSVVVAKFTAGASALAAAGEIASGFIAGLPIVKTAAVASLKSSGQVIVIGGTVLSVKVAIATGLVAAVIAGGTVYYLLLSDDPKAIRQAACSDLIEMSDEEISQPKNAEKFIQKLKNWIARIFVLRK